MACRRTRASSSERCACIKEWSVAIKQLYQCCGWMYGVPTARWKSSSERCLLASGLHALCNVYPVYARASLHASHAAHGKLWFLLACRVLDSPDTMTSAKLIERIVANRAQFEQRQVRLGERVAKSACFGTASRPACCCCCCCCYYHFLRCRRCRLTTPAAAGACNCMCANRITA